MRGPNDTYPINAPQTPHRLPPVPYVPSPVAMPPPLERNAQSGSDLPPPVPARPEPLRPATSTGFHHESGHQTIYGSPSFLPPPPPPRLPQFSMNTGPEVVPPRPNLPKTPTQLHGYPMSMLAPGLNPNGTAYDPRMIADAQAQAQARLIYEEEQRKKADEQRRRDEEARKLEERRIQEERDRLERERLERERKEREEQEKLRAEREKQERREREAQERREREEQDRLLAEQRQAELIEQAKKEWEEEERRKREKWEREQQEKQEMERLQWLTEEEDKIKRDRMLMEDEKMAAMEAYKEEMEVEIQKRRAEERAREAEDAARAEAARLEEEEARKRKERMLQEEKDAEIAFKLFNEDPVAPDAPSTSAAVADDRSEILLPYYHEATAMPSPIPSRIPPQTTPSPGQRIIHLPLQTNIAPSQHTLSPSTYTPRTENIPPATGNTPPPFPHQRRPSVTPLTHPHDHSQNNLHQHSNSSGTPPLNRTPSLPMDLHLNSLPQPSLTPSPVNTPGIGRHAVSLGGAHPGWVNQPRPVSALPPIGSPTAAIPNTQPMAHGGMAHPPMANPTNPNIPTNRPPEPIAAPTINTGLYSHAIAGSSSGGPANPAATYSVPLAHYPSTEPLSGILHGFGRPVIRSTPLPAPNLLPEVLTIEPEPSPPFHIVSHTWKHLVRFVASMNQTRIEPSPAALAREKAGPPHLRVILHFVKLANSDWRIIMYLALESVSKPPEGYRSDDTSVVPFLFPAPEPGKPIVNYADTPIYTILTRPYPVLPLSMPNLAPYLQAALSEAQSVNDNNRSRLVRLVNTTIAAASGPSIMSNPVMAVFTGGSSSSGSSQPEPKGPPMKKVETKSSGGLLRKFRRGKTSAHGQGLNDDTYDIVTPFNMDYH